jgi:ankyrin repeat protein
VPAGDVDQYGLAEILIAHYANLNIAVKYGLRALMFALVSGHMEVSRLLTDAGTDLSLS